MGCLITDNLNRRRESVIETAIIKVLQTEIPAEKILSSARMSIEDYIEFRVGHLKRRWADGELSAYIRLTEIEALKDFIFGGQNNS